MNIAFDTFGKEPMELDLEAEAAEIPELLEYGAAGKIQAHMDVSPLSGDTYLIRGEASGKLGVDCGRCLDKLDQSFKTQFNLIIAKRKEKGLEWVEEEEGGVEDYELRVGPDVLDISIDHIIAEQVILNYNLHPLPDLDAQNRCVQCGRSAVTAEQTKEADHLDPRWAKLEALKQASTKKPSKEADSGKKGKSGPQ